MKLYRQTVIYALIFTVLILSPLSSVYSQYTSVKLQKPDISRCFKKTTKTEFGIKGGLNLSNFSDEQYIHTKNLRLGYNFGVFAKLPINKYFFIQPELLHTTKGAKIVYRIDRDVKGEYAIDLGYIEAPVSIAFRLDPAMHVYAGGYVSFLVSAGTRTLWQDDESLGVANVKRDDLQGIDYGVLGGIGIDIRNMTLGMRYSAGVKAIGKPSAGPLRNLTNNALSIYVGFTI